MERNSSVVNAFAVGFEILVQLSTLSGLETILSRCSYSSNEGNAWFSVLSLSRYLSMRFWFVWAVRMGIQTNSQPCGLVTGLVNFFDVFTGGE